MQHELLSIASGANLDPPSTLYQALTTLYLGPKPQTLNPKLGPR